MNSREREALDRHITGNYGEDQLPVLETCGKCGAFFDPTADMGRCYFCEIPDPRSDEAAAEARGEYSELRTALGFNPAFEAATTAESQAREDDGSLHVVEPDLVSYEKDLPKTDVVEHNPPLRPRLEEDSRSNQISDDKLIGYLVEGLKFECVSCATDKHCPVYRVNIGIYSQQCSACKKLIVKGVKRGGSYKPLNLFDNGLTEEVEVG